SASRPTIVKEKFAATSAKEILPTIRSKPLAAPASCIFLNCRSFSATSANAGSNITWQQIFHRLRRPFTKPPAVILAGTCIGTSRDRLGRHEDHCASTSIAQAIRRKLRSSLALGTHSQRLACRLLSHAENCRAR